MQSSSCASRPAAAPTSPPAAPALAAQLAAAALALRRAGPAIRGHLRKPATTAATPAPSAAAPTLPPAAPAPAALLAVVALAPTIRGHLRKPAMTTATPAPSATGASVQTVLATEAPLRPSCGQVRASIQMDGGLEAVVTASAGSDLDLGTLLPSPPGEAPVAPPGFLWVGMSADATDDDTDEEELAPQTPRAASVACVEPDARVCGD
ncbi:hypothetical protein VPH35_112306 [Triticum aestivum]